VRCLYLTVLTHDLFFLFFFFNDPATPEIYTLSLHDALPICHGPVPDVGAVAEHGDRVGDLLQFLQPVRDVDDADVLGGEVADHRSEEYTSELQSPCNLVCRLLLEKKKKQNKMQQKT